MKVILLGTGDGKVEDRRDASLWIERSSVTIQLDRSGDYKDYQKPDYLFITHYHPDHFSENAIKGIEHIYGPEERNGIKANRQVNIGEVTVIAVPVDHSVQTKTVAYFVFTPETRLLYAPDLLTMPASYELYRGLDFYIGCGSSPDRDIVYGTPKGEVGHISMKNQEAFIRRLAPGAKILWTHISEKTEREVQGLPKDGDVIFDSEGETKKALDYLVWIPGFLSQTGSSVYGKLVGSEVQLPDQARDVDIVMRFDEKLGKLYLDRAARLKVDRFVEAIRGSKHQWQKGDESRLIIEELH